MFGESCSGRPDVFRSWPTALGRPRLAITIVWEGGQKEKMARWVARPRTKMAQDPHCLNPGYTPQFHMHQRDARNPPFYSMNVRVTMS